MLKPILQCTQFKQPKCWLPNLHRPFKRSTFPPTTTTTRNSFVWIFVTSELTPQFPTSPSVSFAPYSLSSPTRDNNPSDQPVHRPHDQKPYWVTQHVRQWTSSSLTSRDLQGGGGGDVQGGATGVIHPCEVCHRRSSEVRRWPEAAARTYTGIFSIPKGCSDKEVFDLFFFFCSKSQK